MGQQDEEKLLRSVAIQNANSILLARQRAEQALLRANEALELKTEELAGSLAMMRATLESTTDGILVTNEVGKVIDFNEKYVQMWRIPREIIHGCEHRQLLETIGQEFMDVQPVRDRLDEIYAFSPSESFDSLELADGRVFERYSKIQVVNERKVGRVWSFRDISRQKKTEEALRESAIRLQFTLESARIGEWDLDLATRKARHSLQHDQVFGYDEPLGEWNYEMFMDHVHPDDRAEVHRKFENAVQNLLAWHFECRLIWFDRSEHWIEAHGNVYRSNDNQPPRMLGIVSDITERKQAEQALREDARILEFLNKTGATLASKLELQEIVQAVTDAATQISGAQFGAFFYNQTDADGDVLTLYTLSGAPREAFEKFGHPRATALFGPTFRGEDPIRCDDVLQDPRYGKMAPHAGMPQGHLPVRSYLAVPVISRTGDVMGGLFFGHPEPGVFTERSERIIVGIAAQAAVAIDNARLYEAAQKSAEEREMLLASERMARAEAERMSEMKDEFLATLSHELRTPLSAILGWSHILRRGTANEADLRKGLDTIERNARVQTQLIEDLLDMSRITSGKVRLDIQPVEPLAVIEAALETVRPAADAKGIRIEKLLDPSAGPISGDPSRLQQVIWNLVSNAIKFTPKEGKVQVLLERVNSHIEISVADTGIGIKPEFLPHVFERFRQADGSPTRRYGGLGLGLSIVKHLVELHGGTVHVRSAGTGRGATFAVHLPLMVVQRQALNELRHHPRTPNPRPMEFKPLDLSGLKILVVDDEPDARDLVKRVLADCNAQVITANSAEDALLLVEMERPHVLVSDIGMPDVDGFELIRRVRALGGARGGNVPAIALTAFARSEDRTRALHAGYQAHVTKPAEPSELIATVASAAGKTGLNI
jgi:PAS domain S-box-containing protein